MKTLIERIDLLLDETEAGGVATTTGDIAKYPEKTKFGRKKKKKSEKGEGWTEVDKEDCK